MASTKRLYGLDWPGDLSEVFIHLLLAKKHREYRGLNPGHLDPYVHLLTAARALFSAADFTISPWTEQHAHDWTTRDFCVTWGGASCSKSNDYGCFAVLDWITDPTETYTVMASTTKGMLVLRSYEAVLRYFRLLKRNPWFEVPGKESNVTTAILNAVDSDTDDTPTSKASIRGVAVKEGSREKSRANLQGAHLPYVRMILDEMAQLPEAAVDARMRRPADPVAAPSRFSLWSTTTAAPRGVAAGAAEAAGSTADMLGGFGSVLRPFLEPLAYRFHLVDF
jgi:hypothetical protein